MKGTDWGFGGQHVMVAVYEGSATLGPRNATLVVSPKV